MRRRTFRFRVWFVFATATMSLVLASAASAALNAGNSDGIGPGPHTGGTGTATLVSTGGFSWVDATAGAAVALGLIVCSIALVYFGRTRGRFVPSH